MELRASSSTCRCTWACMDWRTVSSVPPVIVAMTNTSESKNLLRSFICAANPWIRSTSPQRTCPSYLLSWAPPDPARGHCLVASGAIFLRRRSHERARRSTIIGFAIFRGNSPSVLSAWYACTLCPAADSQSHPLFVAFCFHSLVHGLSRGSHRGTFRQYSSYSARNIRRSVGSSYPSTNRCTPSTTRHATATAARFARPNTTHSPVHPARNPTYIGLRT